MKSIIISLLYNAIFLSLFLLSRLPRGIATPIERSPSCDLSKYVTNNKSDFVPMPIDVARSCLTSFPYDSKIGNAVIDSITKTLTEFYIFVDSARDPPTPGYTYNATDIVGDLETLKKRHFVLDYDFTLNVVNLLDQLKDAHTSFHPSCYETFVFLQGMDLYSAVESNGQQSIKVWKDFLDDTNNDCEVLQIDGVPAFQAIKQFAEEQIGLSRDLGVRFNIALASLSADGTSDFSNFFTRRQYLPSNNEITYTLQCGGKKKEIVRTWTACGDRVAMESVTNSKKYWERNCSPDFGKENLSSYRKLVATQKKQPTKKRPTIKTSSKSDTICSLIEKDPVKLHNGELLVDLTSIKFYHLPEQNVGVVTMSSVDDIDLTKGFQEFINKGVKKVILDLTNNGGGTVAGAHYLNHLLFPKTNPSFDTDFRVSDLMRLGIKKSKSNSDFIGSPGIWLNPQTKKPFNDSMSFIGNNVYTRGGVSESYTSRITEIDPKQPRSKNLPWKATDYAILTNGFCGSSCSLIATHLAEENNVLTISVGGFANTPMAFASFTGGQVFKQSLIVSELSNLSLSDNPLAPSSLPITGDLTFAIREAYSRSNPNEVLEFSFRPATKRLYYDSKSSRDPSELWLQVAKILLDPPSTV